MLTDNQQVVDWWSTRCWLFGDKY